MAGFLHRSSEPNIRILEKLDLGGNKINNRVIASFAGALAINIRLRQLRLSSISESPPWDGRHSRLFFKVPLQLWEYLICVEIP
jgi:hypothetical protein